MPPQEPDWKYTPPAGGWLQRNVIWLIPTVILMVGLPLACCGGGIWMLWKTISAPYDAALELVENDPYVIERLGKPIRGGQDIDVRSYNNDGGNGNCSISFAITGPKGGAVVSTDMVGIDGNWTPTRLKVAWDDGGTMWLVGTPESNGTSNEESDRDNPPETALEIPRDPKKP